ncbi:DegV family protein [Chloroflexota bacterium]
MTVKIVTDSSADLPAEVIKELGITVVPLYVRFGEQIYRDRVEISEDEFYQRLSRDPVHPSTTQPTPQDFVEVYQKLAKEADGIISIHLSAKLSGTHESAIMARDMIEKGCPIEIFDSQRLTMALGLIVMAAATMAKAGKDMAAVLKEVKAISPKIDMLALLDTLKYLQLGGRIGKAQALLGSLLNIKPVLTLKDGEVVPVAKVRTRSKGIDRLLELVKGAQNIQDLSVVYNTTPDEAQALVESIGAFFPKDRITLARVGPVLGVHMGPGSLVVALREG